MARTEMSGTEPSGIAPMPSVKAGCAKYSDRVCVGRWRISSKKQT
jgi:hypothetical protein